MEDNITGLLHMTREEAIFKLLISLNQGTGVNQYSPAEAVDIAIQQYNVLVDRFRIQAYGRETVGTI